MVIITIKKGIDPELQRPRFLCDNILKKDVPPPFNLLVDSYKFILMVGRPKSGKTSLLYSLFKDKRMLKKCWNNIIVCMPIQSLQSIHQKDNIFKDVSYEKFYPDLDAIDDIKEQVKFYADHDENSVIIIDDQMSSLKNPYIEKVLCDIISNRRHYRTSIILCTQLYERVPLKVRKLINDIFVMFRPSKKEINMIFDELLEYKPEIAEEIYKIVFNKPYDWLMMDVPEQKIFSKYDELIIKDE